MSIRPHQEATKESDLVGVFKAERQECNQRATGDYLWQTNMSTKFTWATNRKTHYWSLRLSGVKPPADHVPGVVVHEADQVHPQALGDLEGGDVALPERAGWVGRFRRPLAWEAEASSSAEAPADLVPKLRLILLSADRNHDIEPRMRLVSRSAICSIRRSSFLRCL